jgi:tetratricopeptide (TPR) repeat protein
MKHLILYIDLEYIKAIVKNDDGKYSFVKTDDRDSVNCFWLFFLIDQYNKRVKHKKSYKLNVHNKKPGYFSYSYPLERDFENETILFDNHNCKWEELLSLSGIIDKIKSEFKGIQSDIPTYIAYSSNVSFRNREVLNHYLLKQGINKISDALTISELYTFKFKDELNASKEVIVLESLNNDLNLSYLHLENEVYVKPSKAHKLLENKGNDPRINTLVDCVVNELTRQSNFLRRSSNRSSEIKQLKSKSQEWLNRLNMVNTLILDDIVLTCDPGVKYRIRVSKKEVEEKTGKYIRDLLAEIKQFCNDVNGDSHKLHYVLLGDSFNNKSITSRFSQEFGESSLTHFQSSKIADVLTVYNDAYDSYKSRIDEVEVSRRYKEKIELGNIHFCQRKFEKAKTAYFEAKNILETDEVVLKIGEVEDLIQQEKKNLTVFKTLLNNANDLVEKNQLNKAIDKIDEALEIFPDNELANNQRNLIKLKIDRQLQDYNRLYNQALELFKKDNFKESLDILNNALSIVPNDKKALELIERCKKKQRLTKIHKEALTEYYNHNFLKAKEIYERDLSDAQNQKMAIQCQQLAAHSDDLSKQMMLVHEAVKEKSNLKQVFVLLSDVKKSLSNIKNIDEDLDFGKFEHEIKNYTSKLNSMVSKAYNKMLKNANDYFDKKDLNRAILEYKNILELVPNDSYCNERIQNIEKLQLEYQSNKEKYDKLVIEGKSKIEEASFILAERLLKEAIELCPNEKAAKEILDQYAFEIMEIKEEFQANIKKGDRNFIHQDFENARGFYEKALLIAPSNEEIKNKIRTCELKLEFKFNSGSPKDTKATEDGKTKEEWSFNDKNNGNSEEFNRENKDWTFDKKEIRKESEKKQKNNDDWDFSDKSNKNNDKFNF